MASALIFDASAIVKRYLRETGTAWVQGLVDPSTGNEIFLTRIARVEITATVSRRGRSGLLGGAAAALLLAQFRHDAAHQYNILEITPGMLAEAERLAELHGLRGYDAVQLAATSELHQGRTTAGLSAPTLVSADLELNAAAVAEGIAVEDPTTHP